ncbi:helix-turn-helix domain-containing protein [Salana multivorans]
MEYSARITSSESLGRVLAQARALNGWSQRDLAERLGTSQRYVWEIEAGKPSIFTERLFAYIRETGTTLTATIREPDEPTSEPTPDESSPDTTTAGERRG